MEKAKLLEAVEKHRALILDAERYIWAHPETGYREKMTSAYLEEKFSALGYTLTRAEDIPGFYTVIDTGREGPEVMILGEMDSLICPTHKEADKATGFVHACGHHAQCAALLGIAAALKEEGALDGLSGKIRLCAVPAEELIEIEYRNTLIEKGLISYYGGKTEFLSRGYFDGVDIAFMVHTNNTCMVRQGSVGFITKNVTYKGTSAHAGGSPWNGRNALYAASQGLNAANALRETFREQDLIRFHPIITHGGDAVNAIPETARIESYVRGKTFEAIKSASAKINRALTGAALSLGTNVDICDMPGYSPLVNDRNMIEALKDAADIAIPELNFHVDEVINTGSTDMGDLSMIMPAVHPYIPGAVGTSHGNDYYIDDPYTASVKSAKWQIVMLALLLEDGAERSKKILSEFVPTFKSKREYLDFVDSLKSRGDRIEYCDGTAKVRID